MRKLHKMAVKLVTLVLLNVISAESAASHERPRSNKIACPCGDPPPSEFRFFHIPLENVYSSQQKDCRQLCLEDCSPDFCVSYPNIVWNPHDDVINHALGANSSHQDKVSFPPPGEDAGKVSFPPSGGEDGGKVSSPPPDKDGGKVPFPSQDEDGGRDESLTIPRARRSTHKCTPPPVEHASMDCSLSGELTLCDIRCSFGYAIVEDGKLLTKTNRLCKLSNAVWTPKGTFPVCRPRLNCKAVLVRPGKLTCYPGTDTPYCDISCKPDYENGLGEVVMGRYECVDERFGDNLPHCATLDETVKVIGLSENRQTSNATQTGKE